MSGLAWAVSVYAVLSLLSMATMSLGAAALAVAILLSVGGPAKFLAALREECRRPEARTYLLLSLALGVACLASLIWAQLDPLSYDGKIVPVRFRELLKLWYFIWPPVLLVALRRLRDSERAQLLRIWLFAFGALSVLGIIQYFIGWPRPQRIPGNDLRFHATLFLGHHLSVASVFIFPFFVALDSRRGLLGKWKIPICALGFVTLMLTYSRTLWVALPIGILIWGAWALPRRLAVALGIAVVIGAAGLSQNSVIHKRMTDALGVGTRQELWKANFEFFRRRPLTGAGWRHNEQLSGLYLMEKSPGQEVFSGHAHNNLIDMLGGAGLLGALAWIAWNLGALRLASLGSFRKGLVCAWIVFHLNGLTQVNFWEAKVEHQVMWVMAWALLLTTSGREDEKAKAIA